MAWSALFPLSQKLAGPRPRSVWSLGWGLLLLWTAAWPIALAAQPTVHVVTREKPLSSLNLSGSGTQVVRFRDYSGIGSLTLTSFSGDSLIFERESLSDSILSVPAGATLLKFEGLSRPVVLRGLAFKVPGAANSMAISGTGAPNQNLLLDSCIFMADTLRSSFLTWEGVPTSKAEVRRSLFTADTALAPSPLKIAADTLVLENNLFSAAPPSGASEYFVLATAGKRLDLSFNTFNRATLRSIGDGVSSTTRIEGNLFLNRSSKEAPLRLSDFSSIPASAVNKNGRDPAYSRFDAGSYEASFTGASGNGSITPPSAPSRTERFAWVLPTFTDKGFHNGPNKRPRPYNVYPGTTSLTSLVGQDSLRIDFPSSFIPREIGFSFSNTAYPVQIDSLRTVFLKDTVLEITGSVKVASLHLPSRPALGNALLVAFSPGGTAELQAPNANPGQPLFPNTLTASRFIPTFSGQNTFKGADISPKAVPRGLGLRFDKVDLAGITTFSSPSGVPAFPDIRPLLLKGKPHALKFTTTIRGGGGMRLFFSDTLSDTLDARPYLEESVFVQLGENGFLKPAKIGGAFAAASPFRSEAEARLVERLGISRGKDTLKVGPNDTLFTENADKGFQARVDSSTLEKDRFPHFGNLGKAYRFNFPGRSENTGEIVTLKLAKTSPGQKVYKLASGLPALAPVNAEGRTLLQKNDTGAFFLAEYFPIAANKNLDTAIGADSIAGLLSKSPGAITLEEPAKLDGLSLQGYRVLGLRKVTLSGLEIVSPYTLYLKTRPGFISDSVRAIYRDTAVGGGMKEVVPVRIQGRYGLSIPGTVTEIALVERVSAPPGRRTVPLDSLFELRVVSDSGFHLRRKKIESAQIPNLTADLGEATAAHGFETWGRTAKDSLLLRFRRFPLSNRPFRLLSSRIQEVEGNPNEIPVTDSAFYFLATRFNISKEILTHADIDGVKVSELLASTAGSLSFAPGTGFGVKTRHFRLLAAKIQTATFKAKAPYAVAVPVAAPERADSVIAFVKNGSRGWSRAEGRLGDPLQYHFQGVTDTTSELVVFERHEIPESSLAFSRPDSLFRLDFKAPTRRPYHVEHETPAGLADKISARLAALRIGPEKVKIPPFVFRIVNQVQEDSAFLSMTLKSDSGGAEPIRVYRLAGSSFAPLPGPGAAAGRLRAEGGFQRPDTLIGLALPSITIGVPGRTLPAASAQISVRQDTLFLTPRLSLEERSRFSSYQVFVSRLNLDGTAALDSTGDLPTEASARFPLPWAQPYGYRTVYQAPDGQAFWEGGFNLVPGKTFSLEAVQNAAPQGPRKNYSLVGFPFDGTLKKNLETGLKAGRKKTLLLGLQGREWDTLSRDGDREFKMNRGQGFLFAAMEPFRAQVQPGDTPSLAPLTATWDSAGWKIISNPFPFSFPWDRVRIRGATLSQAYGLSSGNGSTGTGRYRWEITDTVKPFTAVAIYAFGRSTLTLEPFPRLPFENLNPSEPAPAQKSSSISLSDADPVGALELTLESPEAWAQTTLFSVKKNTRNPSSGYFRETPALSLPGAQLTWTFGDGAYFQKPLPSWGRVEEKVNIQSTVGAKASLRHRFFSTSGAGRPAEISAPLAVRFLNERTGESLDPARDPDVTLEPGKNLFLLLMGDSSFIAEREGRYFASLPSRLEMLRNYPNPARGFTEIRFRIPAGKDSWSRAGLDILDPQGRLVHREDLGPVKVGFHSVKVDVRTFRNGLYFYHLRLEARGKTVTLQKKMVVRN